MIKQQVKLILATVSVLWLCLAGQPSHAIEPLAYFLFFDYGSVDLAENAQNVLVEFVNAQRQFKCSSDAIITLIAHTDTAEAAELPGSLSDQRAQTVKAALIQRGLNGAQIRTVAKGATDPLLKTGPGMRESQNRRVFIDYEIPSCPGR